MKIILFIFIFSFNLKADLLLDPILNNDNCFHGQCISNNFKSIISFSRDINAIIEKGQKKLVEETLNKIPNGPISAKRLNQILSPIYLEVFNQTYTDRSILMSELIEVTKACDKNPENNDKLKDQIPLEQATILCVKDNVGVFNVLSVKSKCKRLLEDALDFADMNSSYPGSYEEFYVDYFLKHPQLDRTILEVYKKLEGILGKDWQSKITSYDLKNRSSIPLSIKDLDLGKLVFQIAKNREDALAIIQIFMSDPGARVIKNSLRVKLRKDNLDRFNKLHSVLSDENVNATIDLQFMNDSFLGMNYKRNWSNRNYKGIAGVVLGFQLKKKGYSDDEIAWVSEFIGEAYKIKAHILPAIKAGKDTSGDRPYFVMDSVGHRTGSILGIRLFQNKNLDEVITDISKIDKESEERANDHWESLNGPVFKKIFKDYL